MADLPAAFGPYQLLRQLGQGAMGEVYLARPFDPGRGLPDALVIKQLRAEIAAEETFRRRFAHEAQIATAIDSPHVVKVFDVGSVRGVLYIAMEYIPGWPLARVIAQRSMARDHLSLRSAADIMEGILLGLASLHEAGGPRGSFGIVHRDLAPKNIMLGQDGRVCLIDLGIGRSKLRAWKTRTGAVLGSVGYMPPEQVKSEAVDHRTDLYAAGVVLFELLTLEQYIPQGRLMDMLEASLTPRYRAPSSVRSDLPRSVDQLLERALAAKPKDRFQSGRDFLAALRRAVPREEERPLIPSLIGDLLWEELSRVETETTQLFARTRTDPEILSPGDTHVFAQRQGVQMAPGTRLITPRNAGRSRSASMWTAGAVLGAAGLVLASAAALLFERSKLDAPAELQVSGEASYPEVQPSAHRRDAPEPSVEDRVEAPLRSGGPRRRAAEKARTEARPEARTEPNAEPPARTERSLQEEDIGRLLDRANALRQRLSPGGSDREEADRIVGDLNAMIATPFVPERDQPALSRILGRLRVLEKARAD